MDNGLITGITGSAKNWGLPVLLALLLNGVLISFIPGLVTPVPDRKPAFESIPGFTMIRIKPPVNTRKEEILPQQEPTEKSKIQPALTTPLPRKPVIPQPSLNLNSDLPQPLVSLELPAVQHFSLPALPQPDRPTPTAATPKPVLKTIYAAGEIDGPLMPLVRVPPVYPRSAKRRGIQGWVDIEFIITRAGRVETVKIVQAEPAGVYEKSVVQAVSSWRFSPGKVNGKPVRVRVRQRVQFRLAHETE